MSRFLGHADAGFTLRTYVHLLDEDLPEPDVLDSLDALERGNNGATQPTVTDRNDKVPETPAIPLRLADRRNRPNHADAAGSDYESAALTS